MFDARFFAPGIAEMCADHNKYMKYKVIWIIIIVITFVLWVRMIAKL